MNIQTEIKKAFQDGKEQQLNYYNRLRELKPQTASSYYRKWKIKRKDESIKEWLERTSLKDSETYRKIILRQKYSYFYDLQFWFRLKKIIWKRKLFILVSGVKNGLNLKVNPQQKAN